MNFIKKIPIFISKIFRVLTYVMQVLELIASFGQSNPLKKNGK